MSYVDLAPGTHAERMHDHWWWRPGWHVGQRAYTWHITFEGQEKLHEIARQYQGALSSTPNLDPIPLEWLHLTMQGVGFLGEIGEEEIERVIEEARLRLAELGTLDLAFGPAIVADEAIVLPAKPEGAVESLRKALRRGISDVLGNERLSEDPERFRPHVSVAYSSGDHDARPLIDLLERNLAQPVTIPVPNASLIAIHRDHRVYQWHIVEQVPIGR
ncbi:2'-5' RNA ligase family protein [Streptomyces sp. NBC_01508]|uniref:2'-5' RNA ligase family protein n=1 Tax=Streptomyces sp. NBC_01508 TaxID=2903888 RepID=UPI003867AB74